MKKRLPGLVCLLLTLVICVAAARRDLSEPANFVRQNTEVLTALAEEVLVNSASGDISCPGVKHVRSMVYMKDGTHYIPYVEFYMATAVGYSGFYYSPTDIPIPFQGVSDAVLTPTASGWAWEYMGNHGTTTKITDRWYTFKAYL